jgi:hypothetical protein
MADKKISELPVASSIAIDDVSLLVGSDTDYQYSFTTLLDFVDENLSVGAKITFGTTLPQNTTGDNGDVFLKTDTATFYQKINGTWTYTYTISTGNSADGTLLYGIGVPGSATGADNDSYIDTTTGIFYLRTSGLWSQVFSMATGPQGPQGTAGTNGINGTNGNTILSGNTDPSNLTDGVNGDYYINLSTYYFFGPKTNGVWPTGFSLVGGAPAPLILNFPKGSSNPIFIDWTAYIDTFGPKPTVIIEVRQTTAISSFGTIAGGSGYTNDIYQNIPLTGGSGEGAVANINVTGGAISSIDIVKGGIGYSASDTLSASIPGGSGFSVQAQTIGNSYIKSSFSEQCNMDSTNNTVLSICINAPNINNNAITSDEIRVTLKQ